MGKFKNDSFLRKKQIFSIENYCLRDFLRRFLYKHTTVLKICSSSVQKNKTIIFIPYRDANDGSVILATTKSLFQSNSLFYIFQYRACIFQKEFED